MVMGCALSMSLLTPAFAADNAAKPAAGQTATTAQPADKSAAKPDQNNAKQETQKADGKAANPAKPDAKPLAK